MSPRERVFSELSKSGLPVAHFAWPKGSAPELPWIVFYLDDDRASFADDWFWCGNGTWVAELYMETSSSEVEAKVEEAIGAAFGGFAKSEAWVESEGCAMTAYRFDVVERN